MKWMRDYSLLPLKWYQPDHVSPYTPYRVLVDGLAIIHLSSLNDSQKRGWWFDAETGEEGPPGFFPFDPAGLSDTAAGAVRWRLTKVRKDAANGAIHLSGCGVNAMERLLASLVVEGEADAA